MIIADSDVLIDALRGREPTATRVRGLIERESLATTAISAFELLSGAKTESEIDLVERLLAPLPVYPVDGAAATAAAAVRRDLEAAGNTIGLADYLIAGISLSRQRRLMTRNRRHFERVPGLGLAD